MSASTHGPARLSLALLLCLDTLQVAQKPGGHASPPPWALNAARLLGHARGQGWMVAHILRRRPTGLDCWSDAFGLSPRPDERVFHRDQPSAFSCAGLVEIAPPNAELVILGRSWAGSLLQTVREGLERGFAVAVASDAVAGSTVERARLAALAAGAPHGSPGQFALQNTVGIEAARAPLRLVDGGLENLRVVHTSSIWSGA